MIGVGHDPLDHLLLLLISNRCRDFQQGQCFELGHTPDDAVEFAALVVEPSAAAPPVKEPTRPESPGSSACAIHPGRVADRGDHPLPAILESTLTNFPPSAGRIHAAGISTSSLFSIAV
jgi:hypothetical protein